MSAQADQASASLPTEPRPSSPRTAATSSPSSPTPLSPSSQPVGLRPSATWSPAPSFGSRRPRSRQFSRSSIDTNLLPVIPEDAATEQQDGGLHWHSFSLSFVALPAIAGLLFENGSHFMTDVLLLSLGCLFLYWSVKWPWQWYREAQASVVLDSASNDVLELVINDEAIDGDDAKPDRATATSHNGSVHSPGGDPSLESQRSSASQNLRRFELLALMSCFLGPIAVAYLLHALRPHLSRPSGGLVSNSNLTLFILAAEVRPVLHVCRLIDRKTLYWQRLVSPSDTEGPALGPLAFDELLKRIDSLELHQKSATLQPADEFSLDDTSQPNNQLNGSSSSDNADSLIASVKQAIQPQIDALNRAVRRYEKRATAQAALLDARLAHVDGRAGDALALAAAASRMATATAAAAAKPKPKPKPSVAGNLLGGALSAARNVVRVVVGLVLLPWRLLVGAGGFFLRPASRGGGRSRPDGGLSSGQHGAARSLERLTEQRVNLKLS